MKNTLEERIERIKEFRPIDDTFFEVLADDVPFCQEILRVILEDDKLIVKSVTVQKDEKNLVGRSVRLDALCELGDKTKCNIEIQRSDNDNHFKRIRYNASCITASETEPGKRFENVPTVIVVYISEFDLLEAGKTTYHIDKVVRETGEIVNDGLRTICVNTKIDDGTEIAELMKLFLEKEVNNPKFPVFSNRVNYIKHSEGGNRQMCEVMEKYAKEYAKEYMDEVMIEKVVNAIKNGIEPEVIVKIFDMPLETVLRIKEQI